MSERPLVRVLVIPLSHGMEAVADALESNARDDYIVMHTSYIPTSEKGALFFVLMRTPDLDLVDGDDLESLGITVPKSQTDTAETEDPGNNSDPGHDDSEEPT